MNDICIHRLSADSHAAEISRPQLYNQRDVYCNYPISYLMKHFSRTFSPKPKITILLLSYASFSLSCQEIETVKKGIVVT